METKLFLKKNLNMTHRIIRIFIGIVLIGWSAIFIANSWWSAIISAIGGAQIIEGLIGY